MADAEALLFVDDQETEILELQILGQDGVGADENVDLAGFGFFEDKFFFLSLCGSGRSSRC